MGVLSYRRIGAIFKKEWLHVRRDPLTLRMIIAIPIIQLLLFGFAINTDPKFLPTAMLIQEPSELSRSIVSTLENTQYFRVTQFVASEEQGKMLLQKGLANFLITVPTQFTRELMRGEKPVILIEADGTDPLAISSALAVVNPALDLAIQHTVSPQTGSTERPYDVYIHRLYNPEGLSQYNIIPGLIAVVLTMTGVLMSALSLTKERENGTMENLLSMPVKPIEVMAGKIMPYVLIGYLQAALILGAAVCIFKIEILGNIGLLCGALFIFIMCNVALGFTLSTAAQNQMQALQSSMFLLLPSILLSGFMFPFRGMPVWAQALGSILPSTYFMRIVRAIMLKGAHFTEIWPHLWPLGLFTVFITLIAMWVYKTTLDTTI